MPTKPKYKTKALNPHLFLTQEELAARWDLSIETIRRREDEGILIPVRLPGGNRGNKRYRIADIERIEAESLGRPPLRGWPIPKGRHLRSKAKTEGVAP